MWLPSKTHKFGVAVYNWKGDVRCGLPLEIGDSVQILEEYGAWYRGFNTKNRSAWGIFPTCIVTPRPCTIKGTGTTAIAEPVIDPLVKEIAAVLREWSRLWKKLYVERETYRFGAVAKVMIELLNGRKALLAGTLTQDQTRALRLRLVAKLDWGNRKLGLELVPRRGAEAVNPESMSLVELYRVHVESAERAAAWRGTLRRTDSGSYSSNTLNATSTSTPSTVQSSRIVCSIKEFGHTAAGDEAELFLWIHDARKGQPLSDRFRINIAKEGFNTYVERLHANTTVYTDISSSELQKELWLVCVACRIGRLGGASEPRGAKAVRRPLGAGVLPLTHLLRDPNHQPEKEYTFKLYQSEEKDFHQLPDMLIKKQANKCNILPGQPNYGVIVSLRLLSNIQTPPEVSIAGMTVTPKRGFPDVIMPGDVRNDLYFTLEKGEFERGGKSTAKNVLITVTVHDDTGALIQDCVWSASDRASSSYESVVYYHNNSPTWCEHIRLAVPIERFTHAHARLEYRHCSTKGDRKLFGFSFARLMEASGATIRDGSHELYVYKCDDLSKLSNASYLSLPSCANDTNLKTNSESTPNFTRGSKEAVTISTLLCSTKLTQNEDLLALLQWRAEPEHVQDTLLRVLRLGDGLSCEELIKFLRDVLDALFALFSTEDGNSTPHSGTVFLVLVSICSLLEETRFQHFKPVLDAYIDEHFSAALVYKGLLSSVQHCAEWAGARDGAEAIRKCLRSLAVVFRLAVRSRTLFSIATRGQYEEAWRRDVRNALNSLAALASHPPRDHLLAAQVALVGAWPGVCAAVGDALGKAEAARWGARLLNELAEPAPSALAKARLDAVRRLVAGALTKESESRNIIVTLACQQLRAQLARREELQLCAELLNELVELLWSANDEDLEKDVTVLCLNTLDALVETVLHLIGGNSPVLGWMVAGMTGALQLMDSRQYSRLWPHLAPTQDRKPLKDFLMRALLVFRHLVDQDVFPPDWMVMRVACYRVLLEAMREFAVPLQDRFLGEEPPQLDVQLWSGHLELGVSLCSCGGPGGNAVRSGAAAAVLAAWRSLGPAQLALVQPGVGALLEATLEEEARAQALQALVALMATERARTGSARRTQAALVDKLDALVASHDAEQHYRSLLHTMLMERVSTEEWRGAGAAFVCCVSRLLERLLDYRAVMQGDEHRDKRAACTLNLLNFYKNEIDRREMYIRYVYKLHDLHIASDNFVEAGCTLLLYAESLSWESETIGVDSEHPDTPEWKRKEALYHQVVQYFDKGKCWEKGLPLLRELANLYESRLCELPRLASVLRTHAAFLDCIMHEMRTESEYFRVGFYGKGCPLFVRNKQFVYRGQDYERIAAFTARLQTEYPSAQILMRNTPPDESIVNADGQYIQICNVKPVCARKNWPSAAPEQLKKYYSCNEVDTFLCDRPLHKPPIDKGNEFKSLWIERTTLITDSPLPGILRWSEVASKSVEEITPVEFACETMEATEKELCSLISQYTADPMKNINPFTMRLQGTIDANVQGGISKYEQAFLTPEYTMGASPRDARAVARLRRLVASQLSVVETALNLHGRLAPPNVGPLHRRLVERFTQMKQNLGPGLARSRRQMSESIVNTPLPPVPAHHEGRSNSLQQQQNSEYIYEDNHFYNRPIYSCEESNGVADLRSPDQRDCASPPMLRRSEPAPTPPPLPPRVSNVDKRNSYENPPIPRKTHKYSAVDISLDGSLNNDVELRDSGISSTSISMTDTVNHNHYDNSRYDELNSHHTQKLEDIASIVSGSYERESPPPIPPKGQSSSNIDSNRSSYDTNRSSNDANRTSHDGNRSSNDASTSANTSRTSFDTSSLNVDSG